MTAARPTPRASISSPRASSPIAARWLDFEFDAKDIVNVRIDRKRKLPVTALLHALGMTSEEILNTFYNTRHLRARQGRLADPVRRREMARPEADLRRRQRRDRRSRVPGRPEDHARAPPTRRPRTASRTLLIPTEEIFGRYSALRPDQREDRRDLHRGRRRGLARESREARQGRHRPDRAARHRSRQHRRLDPQHAEGRQGRGPRPGAVRHLPRHAPRRAADARDRRSAVRRPVLRSRALRPLGRRPRQAQHAPRPRRRGHGHDAPQARTSSRSSRRWSTSRTARARSTTSTISATAACARSASCSRTSIASACSAWSAP